ncbi:MAG: alpha/beta hydrolase [Brevibacterium sp.]
MTRITFKGSSRVLGASVIGASMLLAGGSPALATDSAEPTQSTQQTSPEPQSEHPADELEITLGIDAEVEASTELTIPITVRGSEATTVKIVHASNNETVAGSETELDAENGTLAGDLDGSGLEPGTYIIKSDDDLKSSEDFTVVAPETPSESPSSTPSPSEPGDGEETAGPGESPAATDEPSEGPSEDPAAVPGGLDEYYPELAKELFGQDDGTYKISDPKGGGKGAGNIPSGLGTYYNQDVDLSAENCGKLGYPEEETGFAERIGRAPECGYVIAPIDTKNPEAGNVAIAMMKVPAGKIVDGKFVKTKSQGTVAWNPGGPGGSGMTLGVAGALYEPDLAANFDLVGFDPRGTGGSMPFSQCSTDEQIDADRAEDAWAGDRDDAEDVLNDQAERFANDCIENTGKLFDLGAGGQENLMKHLGTWDAVGDLDLIRSTSQDDKLDFIGFSYGTRLGYVYAQKFPNSVGRLVLDGAVDPGNVSAYKALKDINKDPQAYLDASGKIVAAEDAEEDADDSVNQIAGFQGTFEEFALDCSAKGAEGITWGEAYPNAKLPVELKSESFTCALGDGISDRKELTTAVQTILRSLEGSPVPTGIDGDDRQVTFGDARTGVIQALYSESLWADLAYGLSELKEGESAGALMTLADAYNERNPESGHYDPMLQAFTNIRCTDENSFGDKPDIDALRDLAKRYDEAGPFQSASVSPGVYDYCDFWKFKGTLPKPEKLTAVPNILVVSTSHDSATPYASGVKLARTIDGSLLSVSGASHTSYMSNDENKACTDDTVNNFLSKGTLPKLGDFGPKLPKPDTAVDDRGETITLPNRCKMDTFRADDFTLSKDEAHAGDDLTATVEHLGSEQSYTVAFETGGTLGTLSTDNGGNASGTVSVPADAQPGTYVVQVLDADSKTAANTTLTVLGEDDGKGDDGGKDGDDDDPKGGGDASDGGNGGSSDGSSDGEDNNGNGSGGGSLPRTGAEIWPLLAGALALLTAGGLVYRASRRRVAAH